MTKIVLTTKAFSDSSETKLSDVVKIQSVCKTQIFLGVNLTYGFCGLSPSTLSKVAKPLRAAFIEHFRGFACISFGQTVVRDFNIGLSVAWEKTEIAVLKAIVIEQVSFVTRIVLIMQEFITVLRNAQECTVLM
jgi:hypothetical protein